MARVRGVILCAIDADRATQPVIFVKPYFLAMGHVRTEYQPFES